MEVHPGKEENITEGITLSQFVINKNLLSHKQLKQIQTIEDALSTRQVKRVTIKIK